MTKHNYPAKRKPTGPRPTAGRPSTLKDAVRVTLWLEAEQVAWVKAQGEQGEVIRRLIEQARGTNEPI